jgi:hypothetical protein
MPSRAGRCAVAGFRRGCCTQWLADSERRGEAAPRKKSHAEQRARTLPTVAQTLTRTRVLVVQSQQPAAARQER